MVTPNMPMRKMPNPNNSQKKYNNNQNLNESIRLKALTYTQSNLKGYVNTKADLNSLLKNSFIVDKYTRPAYKQTIKSSELNKALGSMSDITKFFFLNSQVLEKLIYITTKGKFSDRYNPILEYNIGLNLCFNLDEARIFNAYDVNINYNYYTTSKSNGYIFLENSDYNFVQELSNVEYINDELIQKYPNAINGLNQLKNNIRKPFDNNPDLVEPINYILVPAKIKELNDEEAFFIFNDLEHKFIFDNLKNAVEQSLKQISLTVVGHITKKNNSSSQAKTKAFDYSCPSDYQPIKETKQFVLSLPTDNELFSSKYDAHKVFLDALETGAVNLNYSHLVSAYTDAKEIKLKGIYANVATDDSYIVD